MKSHLNYQLLATTADIIRTNQLPHFCSWAIPNATTQLITTPKGQVLQQSLSNYLVHTDLFEFSLTDELAIEFVRDEPQFVMTMMLDGEARSTNEKQQVVTEIKAPCYHITYIDQGTYTIKLNAGEHKLLLFTLEPKWFIRQTENLHEFKVLRSHYSDKIPEILSLPNCPLNKKIINTLKKSFSKTLTNGEEHYFASNAFLFRLIERYQKALAYDNYTTTVVHQNIAAMISSFIAEKFTDEIVENVPKLAAHLGLSESTFYRVSRVAFGKSVRAHVIDLRMAFAKDQIISTSKPIYEIAFLSGYNDAKYFSRAFKKHFNQSPVDLRPCS